MYGVYFHIFHHPRYSVTLLREKIAYSVLSEETRDGIQSEKSVNDKDLTMLTRSNTKPERGKACTT